MKLSVLIPAHNEEAAIVQTVQNCLDLAYPADKLEVVVVSDGSTDRSNELLERIHRRQFKK